MLHETRVTVSVFFLLSISLGLTASEWYVAPPPLGNNNNPGTEQKPFSSIQRGIDSAANGDTVIVALGTYVQNIQFGGKNIVLRSTDPLDPAIVEKTAIDGNQAGPVVTFDGTEDETCVLSGFTVRNGSAEYGGGILCAGDQPRHATIQNNTITGNSASSGGGGLAFCDGTIRNNTVTGNSAGWKGGGLSWCGGTIQNNIITGNSAPDQGGGLIDCNGTIQNNTITGNSAGVGGGLGSCSGTIQNNTITGNWAEQYGGSSPWCNGGGLCACGGIIQNNIITGNSAPDYGGGLVDCHGTIQNNTIKSNSAGVSGGGLCACGGTIQNNTITGNSAADEGGGLRTCDGTIQNNTITGNSASSGGGLSRCNGTIQNNTIAGNPAGYSGGGLDGCHGTIQSNSITGNSAGNFAGGGLCSCNAMIENNTITGNSAGQFGGGLAMCRDTISNCIVWGNVSPSDPQIGEAAAPTYCCIQGWTGGGEGNIALNPQFVDPGGADNDPQTFEDNDYHLSPDSPCIDKGKNEDWMATAVDLDGNPRILQGASSLTVDMGAYEYRFCITGIRITPPAGATELTWKSSPGASYAVLSCTDLARGLWNTEAEVPSAGKLTTWTDPDTASILKFYRLEIK